jgi:hypothetical protein
MPLDAPDFVTYVWFRGTKQKFKLRHYPKRTCLYSSPANVYPVPAMDPGSQFAPGFLAAPIDGSL